MILLYTSLLAIVIVACISLSKTVEREAVVARGDGDFFNAFLFTVVRWLYVVFGAVAFVYLLWELMDNGVF